MSDFSSRTRAGITTEYFMARRCWFETGLKFQYTRFLASPCWSSASFGSTAYCALSSSASRDLAAASSGRSSQSFSWTLSMAISLRTSAMLDCAITWITDRSNPRRLSQDVQRLAGKFDESIVLVTHRVHHGPGKDEGCLLKLGVSAKNVPKVNMEQPAFRGQHDVVLMAISDAHDVRKDNVSGA